jgi:hypothetical protein
VEVRKLTRDEKTEIERRERKHRDHLARMGYVTRALVDESGCFGVVLVEDPETQRKGLLLPDGRISWIDEAIPGTLADAAVSGVTIEEGIP